MADMNEILKHTKSRTDKIKITRLPPSIATDDRPYQSDKLLKDQNETNINHTQTTHKPNTEPHTNLTQTTHKPNTNVTHITHKPNTQRNTNYNTNVTHITHKPNTNVTQTTHKPNTEPSFLRLTGLQRKFVLWLFNFCKISRNKITAPLSSEYIAEASQININSLKTTIQRLYEKKIINYVDYKCGRGGWVKYELPDHICNEIIQSDIEHKPNTNITHITHKPNTNLTQTTHKPNTERNTERNTSVPSSSGLNNNIHTTTTEEYKKTKKLTEEWLIIDIESLSNIGFTMTHLEQIALQNLLPPDIVQDSIHMFAFDLSENDKKKSIKGSPLNYFMGILRNGKPYAPPANYESPENRAMRLYLENKKKQEKERDVMRQEILELEFSEWYYKLSDSEIKKILPPVIPMKDRESPLVKGSIKQYFVENIRKTSEK